VAVEIHVALPSAIAFLDEFKVRSFHTVRPD